ncbi:MAG: NYN domain-containing protein [bacterium]|nr:MAG: NYN domain-containing protein [bacterium]
MRILIDGYNLIRRVPELRAEDRSDIALGREALLQQLSAYRAGRGHRITVVFDGTASVHLGGSHETVRGVAALYSPQGMSADQVIRRMCRENQADVVVSGDREITDAAERAGVTAVAPELFWDRVQEEMYRRLKGEEEEGEGRKVKGEGGRKLTRGQRRDRQRIAKL